MRDLVGTEDDPARIALGLAKDPTVDVRLRIDCALGLVPFVHPKLSYTEVRAEHLTMHADASTVLHELESRLDRISQSAVIDADETASTDCISVAIDEDSTNLSMGCDGTLDVVSARCPKAAAE